MFFFLITYEVYIFLQKITESIETLSFFFTVDKFKDSIEILVNSLTKEIQAVIWIKLSNRYELKKGCVNISINYVEKWSSFY